MQFNLSLHFTYELDIYICMASGLPILEEKVIKYLFVKIIFHVSGRGVERWRGGDGVVVFAWD